MKKHAAIMRGDTVEPPTSEESESASSTSEETGEDDAHGPGHRELAEERFHHLVARSALERKQVMQLRRFDASPSPPDSAPPRPGSGGPPGAGETWLEDVAVVAYADTAPANDSPWSAAETAFTISLAEAVQYYSLPDSDGTVFTQLPFTYPGNSLIILLYFQSCSTYKVKRLVFI